MSDPLLRDIDRDDVLPAMRRALDAMAKVGMDPGDGNLAKVVQLTEAGDVDGLMRDHPVTVVWMVQNYLAKR